MIWTDEPSTIPSLLTHASSEYGEHPAVRENEVTTSYSELVEQVHQVAAAFVASGVQPADRIAIWAPNQLEFILVTLGAQFIGATMTPLNTRYRGHEAHDILQRSQASILFVSNGFLGTDYIDMLCRAGRERTGSDRTGSDRTGNGSQVIAGLDHLGEIINVGTSASGDLDVAWNEFLRRSYSDSFEAAQEFAKNVGPDDVSDILFTSGTTGAPKGVKSAHRQTIGVARAWAQGANLTTDDNYAIVNPFFHTFGYKAGFVASFLAGTTIIPVPFFDTASLLQLIQDEAITVLPGAPTIFTSLMNHEHLSEYDISSLRFSIAGAASVPESLFHDMQTILGIDTIAQSYGLTECVVATQSRPNEDPFHVAETTGPPVPGTEVRIADTNGQAAPVGQDGEILLRGDTVMLGYLDDEEATAEAIDADGWLHTGDVGRLDEHGCLKITDRVKDVFTVGGFNVYPAEIESVLSQFPAVSEVAVIGIDDARLGSVGQAHVILKNTESKPTTDELFAFCKERLANFKVPHDIVFVDELPRNAMGKILKTELSTS